MYLRLFLILYSFSSLGKVITSQTGCESFSLPGDNHNTHVICKGNFTELESLKEHLQSINDPITAFTLQSAFLDVLPPDMFHDVSKHEVQKIVFENVTLELLAVPELGDPPLKSIKDTVETLEIYDCKTVFAWDLPSLFFKNLKNIIIQNSEVISISIPFFFWPELQFVQVQNASLKWLHDKAFRGNKELVICSLAHNKISEIVRTMFPLPAVKLYSLDLSFNRLKSLPHDMFTKMDMLHELKLDNNQLTSISSVFLQPVWNNLTQLWLDDNDVQCDSLCWIAEKTVKPMFLESSKCTFSGKVMFINMYLERCIKHP